MQLSDKNLREKEFHNKLQSKTKGRFENIFYKAIYNSNEDFFNFLELNSSNSDILTQLHTNNVYNPSYGTKLSLYSENKIINK